MYTLLFLAAWTPAQAGEVFNNDLRAARAAGVRSGSVKAGRYVGPTPARLFAQTKAGPYLRRDVKNLDADSQVLRSFRKGIEAMKRLPDSDPHSWSFQANIHGFTEETRNPDATWGQCQHGNWWFLPWHRAYLYHLEKIVRKYAEDDTFAFPYWNYTDATQRQLPVPFRDAASSLYDSTRRAAVNSGQDRLEESVVGAGLSRSLSNLVFADFNPGLVTFGGPALTGPQHTGRPHGAFESVPHDMVHGFIGGNMGRVDLAARDPIFCLHHANIDRLWEVWLRMGQGRANPANDIWLNQQFTFFDENKQRVSIAVRQLVDIQTLEYQYEGLTTPAIAAARQVGQTSIERIATLRREGQRLGSQPVTVTFQPSQTLRLRPALQAAGKQVQLCLEDVRSHEPSDTAVAVYVNLPHGTRVHDPRSPHFAGYFTFFHTSHHGGQASSIVDITRTVSRLKAASGLPLSVTLMRVGCGTAPVELRTPLTFNQITLSMSK
jgi:tyrosinase